MKWFRNILCAIAFLPLAACNVTTEQIQQATVQACGFLPTAVIVSSFIPAVAPYGATAGAIAQAICDAIAAQQQRFGRLRGGQDITVQVATPGGQVLYVTGHFVPSARRSIRHR